LDDPDRVLRERDAEKWDEGYNAQTDFYDPDATGDDFYEPTNPYREQGKQGMSRTEYTPTLTGDVRHYFNQAVRDLGVNGYAAFDRALASHDAQVRAEALREAAHDFAEGGWSDAFLEGRVEDDVS